MEVSDPDRRTFGERVRLARAKISQAQLAGRAGISKRSIASYEAGETIPNVEIAARIASALGVTLDELAGLQRPAQQPPQEVVLLIDGVPWVAHAERRTESRTRLEQALEDARAFEASRGQQVPRRDRRRRTR